MHNAIVKVKAHCQVHGQCVSVNFMVVCLFVILIIAPSKWLIWKQVFLNSQISVRTNSQTLGYVRTIGSGNNGSKDGIAEEAQFSHPTGISDSETDGSLLVCDYHNHKIRKIIFEGTFV